MRIDAHVHGAHAERDATGKLIPPLMPAWRQTDMTPQAQIQFIRDHGIDRVLLLDGPEITFPLRDIFGDFVIPCPWVDMDVTTPAAIQKLLDRGACGIKFIAPGRAYGSDCYFPLYEVLRDNRALAVFHTGFLSHNTMFNPGNLLARPTYINLADMHPLTIDRIGRAFPDLKILMAHFGNPNWENAWQISAEHPNVYTDLSGGTAWRRSMDMWSWIFAPNGKLDTKAVSKLCFGTDGTTFVPGQFNCAHIIDFYERLFERLRLPADLRELVNYGNILRLIKR